MNIAKIVSMMVGAALLAGAGSVAWADPVPPVGEMRNGADPNYVPS
jgi:hypothetical protein